MLLQVNAPAPAYFDFDGRRYVGSLKVAQKVTVEAISDRAYRVKGIAQQGQILGWVDPRYLQTIPEEVLANLKAADERRQTVEALIAENEVAIGMTPEEVDRSIGKPQKTTNRSGPDGQELIWEYVKYAKIPQTTNVIGPNGAATIATTYIQTPVGTLTVNFKEGAVESLDQTEGTILSGNQVTIVAQPIFVYW